MGGNRITSKNLKLEIEALLNKYDINGRHEPIGQAVSDDQFKGKMIEEVTKISVNLSNMEKNFADHIKSDDKNFFEIKTMLNKNITPEIEKNKSFRENIVFTAQIFLTVIGVISVGLAVVTNLLGFW